METMLALVKKEAKPGLWLDEVPMPRHRNQRRADQGAAHRNLRHRRAHRDLGRLGAEDDAGADGDRPRIRRPDRRGGLERHRFPVGDIVSGEGHVVCGRCRNCLAGRRHLCKDTKGIGVNRPAAFAQYLALPMTNVWAHDPNIPRDVAVDFRPVRQRGAHGASIRLLGRRRADHRRGPDRNHGRGRRPARGRRQRRGDRRQSVSTRPGAADGCDPDRRRSRTLDRNRPERAGNERGV